MAGTFKVKAGLAQMAKGGIIMDVTTAEEARIAEEAGVCTCLYVNKLAGASLTPTEMRALKLASYYRHTDAARSY